MGSFWFNHIDGGRWGGVPLTLAAVSVLVVLMTLFVTPGDAQGTIGETIELVNLTDGKVCNYGWDANKINGKYYQLYKEWGGDAEAMLRLHKYWKLNADINQWNYTCLNGCHFWERYFDIVCGLEPAPEKTTSTTTTTPKSKNTAGSIQEMTHILVLAILFSVSTFIGIF